MRDRNEVNRNDYETLFLNIPGFGRNEHWGKTMWEAILEAERKIKHGELSTLEDILCFFSIVYSKEIVRGKWFTDKWRARFFSQCQGFGTPELSRIKRQGYVERTKKTAEKGQDLNSMSHEEQLDLLRRLKLAPPNLQKIKYLYFQEEEGLILTGSMVGIDKFGGEMIGWVYVDAPTALACIQKAESCARRVMSDSSTMRTDETLLRRLRDIAQVHWWIANAIPFSGGTAGIADMACKTLLRYSGIKISTWKPGIAPDMEAFLVPLKEFTEKYKYFFESDPSFKE